ncbi:putative Polyketide cyclase/dehydrase and lipid transport superfamily protein [Hibiscus syriacus]|uniref:Polyketide cyclase/dehydrase and lipid transport superfamily protein n=1 Tax=Hibiscus syriacus TaxID=106335 RepID=A0A6A2Y464_HIBSY|nr:lachrymatory-factor synthase [Hibiscus syriacus]KAE8678710.1 putative Polyketide cyclase/dehydrase and lipid transport superfamily protein [Hibiscus syriacus]
MMDSSTIQVAFRRSFFFSAFFHFILTKGQMKQNSQPKWEAKIPAKLTGASPDQVWVIYTDFFNFHKWFPTLASCYGVHGANGELGCIRFCSGFSISSRGGGGSEKWSKERLIAIDHSNRSLSYEIMENNIGFSSYVSTVKIVPGDVDDGDGCVIEWSFTVDPVEGWQLDDMKKLYEKGLEGLARRIEDTYNL